MLAFLFGYDWSTPATEAARSRKRKTIIDVKLKPGGLSRFGYHADSSLRSRHIALMKAVRSEGYLPIIRRLNVIATFSKNRTPGYSKIFKMDQRWLSEKYEKQKDSSPAPSSRRGGNSSKLTAGEGMASSGGAMRQMADDDETTTTDTETESDDGDEDY